MTEATTGRRPLEGLRILAFTQLAAGPYAMTLLGDLGAEIVKIEDPTVGGDMARRVPPYAEDDDSLYFQAFNRNARSLTLDLRTEEGRELFRRLVAVSDAVYSNPRGDLPRKLGLDYASLKDVNPRIVCCALTGFGQTGPRAADPGYDFLIQALAGFMSVTGDPGDPPTRCGISVVDFSGGMMSAIALLVGLLRARDTGVGGDVDVSLHDTAISMLNYMAVWALNRDWRPQRLADSAHQTIVPAQSFPTADGDVIVMCMKDKFWERLLALGGFDDIAHDARFHTFAGRLEHREALIALLKARFRRRSTTEWIDLLRGQVPCAPVNDVIAALEDEQVQARDMVVSYEHPRFGRLRQVGCPIKVDDIPPRYGPAAALGGDTDLILREWLGMSDTEIETLRRNRVV